MAKRNGRGLPADLVRAGERLADWRRSKRAGSRIPEPLWKTAVRLAGKHGLHRTARTLKLDYYSLKKRVEAAAVARGDENDGAFVELPTVPAFVRECVIELEENDGTLRVHLKGYHAADIAVVGRSLRGSH